MRSASSSRLAASQVSKALHNQISSRSLFGLLPFARSQMHAAGGDRALARSQVPPARGDVALARPGADAAERLQW